MQKKKLLNLKGWQLKFCPWSLLTFCLKRNSAPLLHLVYPAWCMCVLVFARSSKDKGLVVLIQHSCIKLMPQADCQDSFPRIEMCIGNIWVIIALTAQNLLMEWEVSKWYLCLLLGSALWQHLWLLLVNIEYYSSAELSLQSTLPMKICKNFIKLPQKITNVNIHLNMIVRIFVYRCETVASFLPYFFIWFFFALIFSCIVTLKRPAEARATWTLF